MRFIPLALVGLTACASYDPSGIWLIESPNSSVDPTCTEQTDENFTLSDWIVDEGGESDVAWTYETVYQYSDTLEFGQIETTANDGAVLILGDTVLPGVWNDTAEAWVFTWTDSTDETSSEENINGYLYEVKTSASGTLKVTLAFDEDGGATGEGHYEATNRSTWTETDVWDATTVGVSYGQIPASNYLEALDGTSTVANDPTVVDCDAADCAITYATTCAFSNDLTATRTDYEDEDAYAHLSGVTNTGS